MSDSDFAALLCSRLCHDLVSPVGAINNGLEILEDETDASMREAVIDLITKSTQQAAHKLQFFRLAFGAAGGFSAQLDVREAEKALSELLAGSRIVLDWFVSVNSISKSLVKLLLNVSLLVSETLIRGGVLTIKLDAVEDGYALEIKASGDRIILQDAIKDALLGNLAPEDMEPRTAPAYLASMLVQEMGGKLVLTNSESELTVKALVKACN
ncbi:MAG: histidine phosphotransferase [Kordiimonadaceae bacterium]|nr:histidine phosphotransferase [Kordiimonadaceae bacterium]